MAELSRRLIMWGGAAVVAGGGFAFMAGNTVTTNSVGEGQGAASGYSVSGITYQTEQGWGVALPAWSVGSVKFTLTSVATSGSGTGQPGQVMAALMGTDGSSKQIPLPVPAGDATDVSCAISGAWTTIASGANAGAGTGNYSCYFGQSAAGSAPTQLVSAVTGLDVEANQ